MLEGRIQEQDVALRQLRPVDRLQLGETAVIFVGKDPRGAPEDMRALALRGGIAAKRQRPLARVPCHSDPPAQHRGARDDQIELEATRAFDLFKQRGDPREAAIVESKPRLRQAGGEALPEIGSIDRALVMTDIRQRQELELVEILRLPDQENLAPQRCFLHERTRQQQARIVETFDGERRFGAREQRALDQRDLSAEARGKVARLDVLEQLAGFLLTALDIGERTIEQASFDVELVARQLADDLRRATAQQIDDDGLAVL